MQTIDQSMNSAFKPYDDLAVEVLQDHSPNIGGVTLSNPEIAEKVCQIMNWQDFDLFTAHPFDEVYSRATPPEVLAYSLIALLRMKVFGLATARKIGAPGFNEKALTHSNVWNVKLSELWVALRKGEPVRHRWIN